MELENIIVSKASQGQRLHVFPHVCKLDLKDKCIHRFIIIHTYIHSYINRERDCNSGTT
jgi:hypothetical protein